jgi:hypothetical protein
VRVTPIACRRRRIPSPDLSMEGRGGAISLPAAPA